MKNHPLKTRLFCTIALLAFVANTNAQTTGQAIREKEENVILLSPFTVGATQDVGYMATSTLAGTRIRTDLKDLGSAISVVTKEFLKDTAATDAGTLLSYTTNTEVGGYQGNFSGAVAGGTGRIEQTSERTNPQFNQRVRGLGRADLTRGYFLTDIAFDSYNTDQVTVSRGPNSILFGIGSPGGVINNSTKLPIHSTSFNEVSARVDNQGSVRSEFDLNRSVVDGRVAMRIAGLQDNLKYKQKPAWNRDERIYGSVDIVLFEGRNSSILGPTVLRANGEAGDSRGTPVQIIPPSVAYSGWFEPTPASMRQYTGSLPSSVVRTPAEGGTWKFQETYNPYQRSAESLINTNTHPVVFQNYVIVFSDPNSATPNVGAGNGVQGYYGQFDWNPALDTIQSSGGLAGQPAVAGLPLSTPLRRAELFHANSPFGEPFAVGFTVPSLQNRDVFDYHNKLYSGGVDFAERKFWAQNIAIEQSFFKNRLGVELAYDRQHYSTSQDFLFGNGIGGSTGAPYDIYIDIAEFLLTGERNPNLGRAYTRVRTNTSIRYDERDRETLQATLFADLDLTERKGWLRHLGRHRFTGLFSDFTYDTNFRILRDSWTGADYNIRPTARDHNINQAGRDGNVIVYTSGSNLGLRSVNDVRLQQINIRRPQPGDRYLMPYIDVSSPTAARRIQYGTILNDRYLQDQGIGRTTIQARALSWQSYLLDRHIVGLFGVRTDDTKSYARANVTERGFNDRTEDGRWNPEFTRLSNRPALDESGDTSSWSLVGRYPEKWLGELPFGTDLQAYYAESENFNPVGLRNDALGNAISQPTGSTKEFGILASFLNNKITVKLNRFQTDLKSVNATGSGLNINVASQAYAWIEGARFRELGGIPFSAALATVTGNPNQFPIQSYTAFYTAMFGIVPQRLTDLVSPRQLDTNGDGQWDTIAFNSIPNLTATQNQISEGFEAEITANLTPSWRLMVNISQQETFISDLATVTSAIVEEFNNRLQSARLGEMRQFSANDSLSLVRSINETWLSGPIRNVRTARAQNNTIANEQREWRFVGVTNYEFNRGRLKGVSIGGAARWEDKAATGYRTSLAPGSTVPLPELNNPYYDDGLFSGDVWTSYRRKVWKDRVEWTVQLNVRNAFGDNSDVPVKTNPDGTIAVIRIPNPRTAYLTNTFRF